MPTYAEKLATLWPEIVMMIGAVACLITGLNSHRAVRRATPWCAAAALIVAGILVPFMPFSDSGIGLGGVAPFVKLAVVCVGLVLLAVAGNLPGGLRQVRDAEARSVFDAGLSMRGEFFAFFLFSLTGVMLTAGASDLAWLFLALELTSLPTYVMVAASRDRITAQESAVKYFFLGALAAAIFLYGFTLIYGATGQTDFLEIHRAVVAQIGKTGSISPLMLIGVVLAVVGLCFKIAAVPMHFYTADVYQGAAAPVSAFLAFVPKTAGFVALILILGLVGWPLDRPAGVFGAGNVLVAMLWAIAAVTMTVGNVLALVQHNVKRVLAYSSIAHSGYIMVGLLAGPVMIGRVVGGGGGGEHINPGGLANGVAAILFYLVAYGLATIAAFAVLGCLSRDGDEAQTYDDIAGLRQRRPALAMVMIVAMLSLVGLPPLIGFVGKLFLVGSIYEAGFVVLAVILVINSAISAAYYLRIAGVCYFGEPTEGVTVEPAPARHAAAAVAAIAVVLLGLGGGMLVNWANNAGREHGTDPAVPGFTSAEHDGATATAAATISSPLARADGGTVRTTPGAAAGAQR